MSHHNKNTNETYERIRRGLMAFDALIEKDRGVSIIWIIPFVVLILSLWLGYTTLSDEGPEVSIVFKDAPGLEAGKSKVKYKDVEVGLVESIRLSDDLTEVTVTAKMEKHVASHLGANTAFWIVKPQFGLSGVSGLDALTAGNYIGVEFAPGKPENKFLGRVQPPRITSDTPGRGFTLITETAGSLQYGTPIYFRDIQVGQVAEVKLAEDRQSVRSEIFINAPYHELIHDDTRFWLASGLDFSMSAQGVNLKVGSLMSLLSGGITFETPSLQDPKSDPSPAGQEYRLHKDHDAIAEGSYHMRKPFLLYFDDSVRGLTIGAPVEFKGIGVGKVQDIKLDLNFQTQKVRMPVIIEVDLDRLIPAGVGKQIEEYLTAHQQELDAGRHPLIEKMVEKGLRGRLKNGSLLTGQMYVDVDFYPDAPPKKLSYGGQYPEIPTLPSVADELQKNVLEIVAGLKKIPLDKIGQELLGTVQGSNHLLNSADLKEAVHALNLAIKEVHQLAKTADHEVLTLSHSLEKSLTAATKVLEQIEPGAPMAVDLSNALEELAGSARSIRALTDYLERHPESLLQGKGSAGTKH